MATEYRFSETSAPEDWQEWVAWLKPAMHSRTQWRLPLVLLGIVAVSLVVVGAIIAVVSDTDIAEAVFLGRGAHGVIRKPCSKQKFTESVVRAVVKANASSPWVSIAKSIFGDDLEIGTTTVLQSKSPKEENLHNAMYAATIATSAQRRCAHRCA
mgnify:CR=1 FL=1